MEAEPRPLNKGLLQMDDDDLVAEYAVLASDDDDFDKTEPLDPS